MKKFNFRKQYLAYAVLAAVCTGFIYIPRIAEAKFGNGETISTFNNGDVAHFVNKDWYVVAQSEAGNLDNNVITLFCKDIWDTTPVKFNLAGSDGNETTFSNYGSTPYLGSSHGDGSELMKKMQDLYDNLENGIAKNAIVSTDLVDVSVTGVYFYAPSETELNGYSNSIKFIQKDYWTRTANGTTLAKYMASSDSITSQNVSDVSSYNGYYLRPVIRVDQSDAGSTLTGGTESGSYFSAKGGITSGTAFKGEAGSGNVVKYDIAKDGDTAVAGPALTTNGTLVLDGNKITVQHEDAPNGMTAVAAILVNENDVVMASDSTFSSVDGKIDYIATLNSGVGDLNSVSTGTYGLKIFGVNTTTNEEKATQLGAGVVNGIQKTSSGLNLIIGKLNDTTTYNAGFDIWLKNGVGVTLCGDASNQIYVDENAGTVSIDLAGHHYLEGKNINVDKNTNLNIKNSSNIHTSEVYNCVDVWADVNVTGNINFNKTLTVGGTLVISGNVNFLGNVDILGIEGKSIVCKELKIESGKVIVTNEIWCDPADNPVGITLKNNTQLEVDADNLQIDVTDNKGTVKLGDGTLSKKITGGVLNITENVTSNAENIAGTTNTVDADKTLTVTGTTASSTTGILPQAVSGDGSIVIDGTITAMGSIATAGGITVNGSKSLDIKASNVGADITNNGIVNLIDDGTLSKKILGGELNIKGNVTSNAENIAGETNTVDADKTLTVTGDSTTGILTKAVGGAGSTVINGTITAQDTISTSGGIKINSGKSLAIGADKVGADVTNSGTVKLGGSSDFVALNSGAKIIGGAVVIGTADGAEKVSVAASQFDNVNSINIDSNDTLKFTGDVTADKTFSVGGTGKLEVNTNNSNDSKIVLTGDKTLAGITITTGNLQIPADWILSGSAGNYTVTDNDYIVGSNAGSVLTLKLANGNKWKLVDLNKVLSTDDGIGSNYTGKVKFDGEFDPEGATISVKASVSGTNANITNGKIGVYDTEGNILYPSDGSSLSVPDNYVNVASDTASPYEGDPVAVTKVSIDGTTDFVAKGLQIDQSGNVELEIKGSSNVTLVGGTDGNVSTPLVKADGTELNATVDVDSTSTFNVGLNGKNSQMKINTLNNDGTVNVNNAYLEVNNWSSDNGEINVNNNNSVLNVGGMDKSLLSAAVGAGGSSVKAVVGFNTSYNLTGKKLHVGGYSDKQVYLGSDSMLVVKLTDSVIKEASDFNGSMFTGILSNVQSLGHESGTSIYVDGELAEGKYYIIMSGDGVNPDGTDVVWEKDNIYTSDGSWELAPASADDVLDGGVPLDKLKNMIVLRCNAGDTFFKAKASEPYRDIMQAMIDDHGSKANSLYGSMRNVYRKNRTAGMAAMETMLNMSSAASMERSGLIVSQLTSDAVMDHASIMGDRPSAFGGISRSGKASLRNTVAGSTHDNAPGLIDVGRASAVMPVSIKDYRSNKQQTILKWDRQKSSSRAETYARDNYSSGSANNNYSNSSRVYSRSSYGGNSNFGGKMKLAPQYHDSIVDVDKRVWANYIHHKEDVDGLKSGGTERNGTNVSNGVVVGLDLWSGEHSFGGVNITYARTDVDSYAGYTKTTNDIDTYGLGLYARHDYSHCSLIFDAGASYNKNDVVQQHSLDNSYEITTKPKVLVYDAGLRYEQNCRISENAAIVPYIGVRYSMIDADKYANSLGFNYESNEDDFFSMPLGIRVTTNLHGPGYVIKPIFEYGRQWNYKQNNWKQNVSYNNGYASMRYDVLDKRSYFAHIGLEIYGDTFGLGVGYKYIKSDNVKSNKWLVDLNWEL